jgi:hypothetical protein
VKTTNRYSGDPGQTSYGSGAEPVRRTAIAYATINVISPAADRAISFKRAAVVKTSRYGNRTR